jgi:two-component system, NarL family, response regulator YdfI
MIDVLVEASSPDLFAQIADLLRDPSRFRITEAAPDAEKGEDQPQPDVVLVGSDARAETHLDSFAPAAGSPNLRLWNALGVPVLLLVENPARWLSDALPPGVRGILPRNATPAEIAAAIEAVAAGLFVFHPAEMDALPMLHPREPESAPELAEPLVEPLTPREIEVLQLLSAGLGNKEIAARLEISEHTAKFHVASIMGKLGAASRTEAVTLGIRHGLVLI